KAQVDFDFEPNALGRTLSLGFGYDRVDLFYFALTNPGIEPGGETARLTADYAADRLTLFGELAATKTNIGAPANYETDLLTRFALNGRYDVFDAGFLSDTVLTFDGSLEHLRRIETPMGAPVPENWDSLLLSLGLEKTTETGGWAAIYTFSKFADDGILNDDITGHEIYASLDRTFGDQLTVGASTTLGAYDSTLDGHYTRVDATLDVGYDIDPGKWNLALNLGYGATTRPGDLDGASVAGVLTYTMSKAADLVFDAGYYQGALAGESGLDHDRILGVQLRLHTDYSK
ncbi:MAG: hypothetical protein ABI459_03435, partial [Deltaproteobacteria bacterium]